MCVDYHKFELIMAKRNWKPLTNDLTLMFFGIQDATLMAENMVVAGRSLGLGSCFLGSAMFRAEKIAQEYHLPKRVFPLVQLAMGYPAENPPSRPRYPMEFTLFKDKYPALDDREVTGNGGNGTLNQKDYWNSSKSEASNSTLKRANDPSAQCTARVNVSRCGGNN
jgi:hypothetical protein